MTSFTVPQQHSLKREKLECNSNYQTTYRHRRRLESAVSHVLDSLDASISLQETAEQSYYSPVHFQAIFSECLGETFFEYVLRNRLFLAARRLTETHEKLNDLAFLAGFSSQANFTRAFKQWFEISPAKFRKERYGQPLSPIIKSKRKRRTHMVPELEFRPETTMLTCEAKGYMSSRFEQTLWKAVSQLCDLVESMNGAIPMTVEPVYLTRDILDMTRLENGTKMASIEVDERLITADLQHHIYEMPAGLYAKFTHQGILPEQTLNVALFDWLPTTNYALDWGRPVSMKAKKLCLNQFNEAFISRNVAIDQCILREGLGMDILEIENFLIEVCIPVIPRQSPSNTA